YGELDVPDADRARGEACSESEHAPGSGDCSARLQEGRAPRHHAGDDSELTVRDDRYNVDGHLTRVPVRFAKIEGGNGKSQLVAVIQGSDSISMALNKESRDVVKGITEKYNKLVRSLSGDIEKLRPEGTA